jgi:hypothetical protein
MHRTAHYAPLAGSGNQSSVQKGYLLLVCLGRTSCLAARAFEAAAVLVNNICDNDEYTAL